MLYALAQPVAGLITLQPQIYQCVQCDGEVYWSYNMAAHYRVCHSLIPLPTEFIIKEGEINKLKKTAKKN